MAFATESEAKHFLVEKIAARAAADGRPLSDDERWLLGFSESSDTVDATRIERFQSNESGAGFETRMADLLRRTYQLDCQLGSGFGDLYRDAYAALAGGDHRLNRIVELAIGRPVRGPSSTVARVGRFLLLAVPSALAFLIALAGVWGVFAQSGRSRSDQMVMAGMALVFSGFGAYLFVLWLRERRT